MGPVDLRALRVEIDQVDRLMLSAVRQRMALVETVARTKLLGKSPFRDPAREQDIYANVRQAAIESGLDPWAVEHLFTTMIEISVARQQALIRTFSEVPLRLACRRNDAPGVLRAAQSRYPDRSNTLELILREDTASVLEALQLCDAHFAFVPVDSAAGDPGEIFDLLAMRRWWVTSEIAAPDSSRMIEFATEPTPCLAHLPCRSMILLGFDVGTSPVDEVVKLFDGTNPILTEVKSRSHGTGGRRRFVLDFDGHKASAPVRQILKLAAQMAAQVEVLACFNAPPR